MHETLFNKQTWNKATIGSPYQYYGFSKFGESSKLEKYDKIDLNEFPITR